MPTEITLEEIENAQKWHKNHKIDTFYPDEGPLRRELYSKHLEFFKAGATHSERLCISANRVGKTVGIGCFEVSCHATGLYPEWWEGRRFNRPVTIWVAGKTSETTRDILQANLIGAVERGPAGTEKLNMGTGMIPADRIIATSPKAGIPGGVDTIWVRHITGGTSSIGMKSYGKDRDAFEGVARDILYCDEEPDLDVFSEGLTRLISTVPGQPNGLMIVTFTPMEGYTAVVKRFLETDDPDCWYIQIGWKDVPHMTPEIIAQMSRKYLPSQLKARSEGIPAIGEGAIYPIGIDEISVDPFKVPDTWPKCFGMDVGKTAVIWIAWDRDSDVCYAIDEYFSVDYNPTLHAEAIKARGAWIPGAIDPSSLQSNQMDGQKLFEIYKSKGLNVEWEKTFVESGIQEIWMRLSTGRLKFFSNLSRLRMEFQRYHRIKSETVFGVQDKIVKKDDHLIDAMRYGIVSGLKRAKASYQPPKPDRSIFEAGNFGTGGGSSWQAM